VDSLPRLVIRDTVLEGEPVLLFPAGATVLSNGTVAVADKWASAVRYFDRDGALVRTVGRAGEGPGEFNDPAWLGQCGRDSVFVWDSMQREMTVLDGAGTIVREVPLSGNANLFTCGPTGRFVVIGRVVNMLRSLMALRDNPGHRDSASVWIGANGPDSTIGLGVMPAYEQRMLGKFTRLAVGTDRIFVGTGDSAFVGVLDTAGVAVGGFAIDVEPRAPTDANFEAAVESQLASFQDPAGREDFRQVAREMFAPPDVMPPYFGFVVDRHDLLWITLSAPGDGETRLRAVTEAGEHVANLTIPEEITLWEVGDDYLLGTAPDADGVYGVVLYGLHRGTLTN
jgi:hypothetical protein